MIKLHTIYDFHELLIIWINLRLHKTNIILNAFTCKIESVKKKHLDMRTTLTYIVYMHHTVSLYITLTYIVNRHHTISLYITLTYIVYMYHTIITIYHTYQGRIQGGGSNPPSEIGKNMICLPIIVIFHTKYPQNFRASLRSVRFFLSAPPLTWNPGSAPAYIYCIHLSHNITIYNTYIYCKQASHNITVYNTYIYCIHASHNNHYIQHLHIL